MLVLLVVAVVAVLSAVQASSDGPLVFRSSSSTTERGKVRKSASSLGLSASASSMPTPANALPREDSLIAVEEGEEVEPLSSVPLAKPAEGKKLLTRTVSSPLLVDSGKLRHYRQNGLPVPTIRPHHAAAPRNIQKSNEPKKPSTSSAVGAQAVSKASKAPHSRPSAKKPVDKQ
jgi:hypothetical protein